MRRRTELVFLAIAAPAGLLSCFPVYREAPADAGADAVGAGRSEGGEVSELDDAASDGCTDASGTMCLPPSCRPGGPGMTNCGEGGRGVESCCTSPAVAGGTGGWFPEYVSGYRLDRYEITVGRFRQFVKAVVTGWTPANGSGKHTHVVLISNLGRFFPESGWYALWNDLLPTTLDDWTEKLLCGQDPQIPPTWTPLATSNENLPIDCLTWYESYAFCIWDGGFLPTEAEWSYAAKGGKEGRTYPWGTPPPAGVDCTYANLSPNGKPCRGAANNVGAESPRGDGRWGQADLIGNVWEMTLDWFNPDYLSGCVDCAYLAFETADWPYRVMVGGFYGSQEAFASTRRGIGPLSRSTGVGARCARSP